MKKKQSRPPEERALRVQVVVADFIWNIRKTGGELRRREDGTIEVFCRIPLPKILLRVLYDFNEEISAALAKERPASLPYSPDRECPDCGQPFQLIGFDASDQGQGEARLWRCGCHTLMAQAL